MTTRTRRVVTAIDATGKAFSEIHRETQVGDKWYPDDPVSLKDGTAEVDQWKQDFNAAQQAENDQLKVDVATLNAEHAESVAALNVQHTEEIAAIQSQITELTATATTVLQQLSEATTTIASLQLQVDTIPSLQETITSQQHELTAASSDLVAMTVDRDEWKAKVPPPPSPREVTPAELFAKIMAAAPDSIEKIWKSETKVAAIAAATLFTWPGLIDLDSENLHDLLGGLVQAELLTQKEMDTVLA